ncbi:MAG: diphosphate--fructose-6-phosphate 1-phosphotransferase [Anaerolineales bacterium]
MTPETTDNRIGILVGGGPAPGINGVIYAATMEACKHDREVIGIYDGFKHLMDGEVVGIPLLPETVAYIHQEGGSILHTARANPTRSEQSLHNCVAALLGAGITSLVSIGGDDTAFSASRVARYAQENMGLRLSSVHVPKTIDNDLPLPEDIPTFGFETARALGAQLAVNLKRDAATSQHWFLVMTMGRKAGHLALGIGKSAVATVTIIPEEWAGREIRLQEVVDILATSVLLRRLEGKPYGVAILAEGILENLAHADLEALDNVERDEHGHIRLAEVNFLDILKQNLSQELAQMGVHVRLVKQVLGYELRCAPPCAFDVEYTRTLGEAAIDFLLRGGANAIITLQHNQIVPIPYDEMIDPVTGRTEVRLVDTSSYRYQSNYKSMTRLKPEHAGDQALFERLAALTNLSPAQFKQRFGYLTGLG